MTTAELHSNAIPYQPDQQLIGGRYRTRARIGHGRLGEIFAATDESFGKVGVDKPVALQLIPDNVARNNQLYNRLNLGYSELRAAAHPGIVRYFEFGRHTGLGYLVMDLLQGASLRRALEEAESLSLSEVKSVTRSVGEALCLLHARDIVHGNLSTGSVFITDELDVRLLDVVPLRSSDTTYRALATNDPFSRSTVEDDVTDLACLAYEMLAGTHPFRNLKFSEAKAAGLEADRIPALPDDEWKALQGALSFDDDKRIRSVADFMAKFGVTAAERLRATVPAVPPPPVAGPASEIQQFATSGSVLIESPVTAPQDELDDVPDPQSRRNLPGKKAKKGRSPLQAVVLGLLVAGVAAWFTYGQPQVQLTHAVTAADPGPEANPVADQDAAHGAEGTPDPVAVAAENPPDEMLADSAPGQTATAGAESESDTQAAREPGEPLAEQSSVSAEATDTNAEQESAVADRAAMNAEAVPAEPKSGAMLTESVVSVSERDGAARIAPRLDDTPATRLVWWTSEYTASANEDFIPAERQRMVAGDGSVLHIPLINDSVPESRESFFVNFGIDDLREGRIERIATVRVDIVDDDS